MLYNDSLRISYSPFLTLESWRKLLEENGFSNIKSYGSKEQMIIAALA